MRRWIALLAAALSLALPGTAQAVVIHGPQRPYQRWANRAKVPTVPTVELRIGACPGFVGAIGCTSPRGPVFIDPYVGGENYYRGSENRRELRDALYHELGHQFDYVMPTRIRKLYRRIRHETRPWYSPPNSPNEQFAEAYMLCGIPRKARLWDYAFGRLWIGGYNLKLRGKEFRRVCHVIRTYGAGS